MNKDNRIFFLIMSFMLIVAIISAKLFIVSENNKPTEFRIVEGNFVTIDESKIVNFLEDEKINFNIDNLTYDKNVLSINGWALNLEKSSNDKIKILLKGKEKAYMFDTTALERPDVTSNYNDKNNYDMSGFELYASNINIIPDNYEIYIVLQEGNKYRYKKTGRMISNIKPTEFKITNGNFNNNDQSKTFDFLEDEKINFNIDNLTYNKNSLSINGWALKLGENSNDEIKILLKGKEKAYMFDTTVLERPDVTSNFNDNNNYNMSGFELYTSNINIIPDNYEICIVLQEGNKYSYKKTGRIISNTKHIEFKIVDGNIHNDDKSKVFLFSEDKEIESSIDKVSFNDEQLIVKGWAVKVGEENNEHIKILLKGKAKAYMFDTIAVERADVTSSFNDNNNYDMSGFELYTNNIKIIPGNYEIYIILQDGDKYRYKNSGEIAIN